MFLCNDGFLLDSIHICKDNQRLPPRKKKKEQIRARAVFRSSVGDEFRDSTKQVLECHKKKSTKQVLENISGILSVSKST